MLIDARDQVGNYLKISISWYWFTMYIDIHPLTREDVNSIGFLQLTCGGPYSPYGIFGRSTRHFNSDETCLGTGRVNITWTKKKMQEWRQRLGYVRLWPSINQTWETSTRSCLRSLPWLDFLAFLIQCEFFVAIMRRFMWTQWIIPTMGEKLRA